MTYESPDGGLWYYLGSPYGPDKITPESACNAGFVHPYSELTSARAPRLRWSCSLFVGPPKWQNIEVFEPDECGGEFETDEQDTATCPHCGGELDRLDDDPEEIT